MEPLPGVPLNLKTLGSSWRVTNSNIYDTRQNTVLGSQEGETNCEFWLLVVGPQATDISPALEYLPSGGQMLMNSVWCLPTEKHRHLYGDDEKQ